MEFQKIQVCEKEFLCKECFGTDYIEENMGQRGFPFKPYLFQRIIDESYAWLIDAKGIFWIHDFYGEQPYFSRPCERACLHYILNHDIVFNTIDKICRLKYALQGKNWEEQK